MTSLKTTLSLKTRMVFGFLRVLDAVGLARPVLAFAAGRLHRLAKKWEAIFDGFTPSERDVFVSVYPKAGNNWMMQIAVQIAHRGAADFDHIHDLVAWPHFPIKEVMVPMDSPVHDRSPTGLRVIKTPLPPPMTPFNDKAHYLVVIRDPRDTLVSMYHFGNGIIGGLVDVRFTLEQLFDFTVTEKLPVCWAEHAAGWWALRDRDNVTVVTFQEMKADLDGVVRRCAAAMGVALTEAELAAVTHRSGFAYMKAHESQFAPPIPSPRGQGAKMIRSGKVGEGKQALTEAQRSVLDAHYRKKLAALGSDLPYDAMFNGG